MWLLVISHPDKAADSWWWGVWAGVGASRVEVCQDAGRFRVERISGPISGCCSTYLDPRGIPWRDQGGGALLHQIGEIGAAIEQFAGETVAGGWAPPPFPVFLEKEREGRATVQRGCLTGQVMEGGGTHAGVLVSVLFLNWGGWAHVLSGLCFYHAWPLTHTYTVVSLLDCFLQNLQRSSKIIWIINRNGCAIVLLPLNYAFSSSSLA